MHVVIILLILFILLYCFAIFPEMSRQKRMKAFHGIMFAHRGLHSKTHGKFHVSFSRRNSKKLRN